MQKILLYFNFDICCEDNPLFPGVYLDNVNDRRGDVVFGNARDIWSNRKCRVYSLLSKTAEYVCCLHAASNYFNYTCIGALNVSMDPKTNFLMLLQFHEIFVCSGSKKLIGLIIKASEVEQNNSYAIRDYIYIFLINSL